MKGKVRRYVAFWGKSLLWSALLYIALMLLLNWEDITSAPRQSPAITISADSTTTNNISNNAPSFLSLLAAIYCNIGSKI